MQRRLWFLSFALTQLIVIATAEPVLPLQDQFQYRLLATKKTSTMEKEMNEAAEGGFRFESAMGGETSFGGSETVVVMSKPSSSGARAKYQYKLLAT